MRGPQLLEIEPEEVVLVSTVEGFGAMGIPTVIGTVDDVIYVRFGGVMPNGHVNPADPTEDMGWLLVPIGEVPMLLTALIAAMKEYGEFKADEKRSEN